MGLERGTHNSTLDDPLDKSIFTTVDTLIVQKRLTILRAKFFETCDGNRCFCRILHSGFLL